MKLRIVEFQSEINLSHLLKSTEIMMRIRSDAKALLFPA